MSSLLGNHATALLLSAGEAAAGTALAFSRQCLEGFLQSCHHSGQVGLATSYIGIIADSIILRHLCREAKSLFGQWHCIAACAQKTPPHGNTRNTNRDNQPSSFELHHNFTPFEDIIRILESSTVFSCKEEGQRSHGSNSSVDCYSDLATQIHSLLDKAPWKPCDYTVLDVLWLIPGLDVCSPRAMADYGGGRFSQIMCWREFTMCSREYSSAVGLYGAFKRLKEWHNAHIQIVHGTNPANPQLQEWREALDVAVVSSKMDWCVSPGIIWRGALHFVEHKVPRQATPLRVVFPGFALTMTSELTKEIGINNMAALLEAVGLEIGSSRHPSHLDVLQIIDTSTLPLFWKSPLFCKLSLSSHSYPSSAALFKTFRPHKYPKMEAIQNWSQGRPGNKSTGLLVRLCLTEESSEAKGYTTSDWLSYVQSMEDGCLQTESPSLLAACEPGPVLLICPNFDSDQSHCGTATWSCDTWFLWQPEAITSRVFAHSQSLQIAHEESDDSSISSVCMELPTVDLAATTSKDYCDTSVQDFWHQLSKLPCELDLSPSEWPEIKALQAHEWLQRKMIRRLATPDLMFGHVVAPPLSKTKDSVDISDVLGCFNETGSPVLSELSPIAMNDPTKVTRVYNPANMDVSYTAMLASTPSSKKQCHGVSYCLSAHDSSLDARLMKIQQRCLVSERASNCSTANTPRVDRRRKRRRSQELPSSSMGQEEKEKAESVIEAPQARSKSRFLPRMRTTPKKIHPLKATKSPVIKLSKVKQLAKSGAIGDAREAGKKGLVRKKNSGLSCEVSASTRKEFLIPVLKHVGVCKPEPGKTMESVTQEDGFVCNSANLPQDMVTPAADGEQGVKPMGVQTRVAVVTAAVKPCPSGTLLTPPDTQASGVRRSPRKNKWKVESSATDEGESSGTQEEERSGTLKREKRSQRHKKRLEQVIVVALKKKGMRHSHPCFRKCYNRLFNLSKSFLKDLRTSKGLSQEMKRIVEVNVSQVITFELRQAGLPPQ